MLALDALELPLFPLGSGQLRLVGVAYVPGDVLSVESPVGSLLLLDAVHICVICISTYVTMRNGLYTRK